MRRSWYLDQIENPNHFVKVAPGDGMSTIRINHPDLNQTMNHLFEILR